MVQEQPIMYLIENVSVADWRVKPTMEAITRLRDETIRLGSRFNRHSSTPELYAIGVVSGAARLPDRPVRDRMAAELNTMLSVTGGIVMVNGLTGIYGAALKAMTFAQSVMSSGARKVFIVDTFADAVRKINEEFPGKLYKDPERIIKRAKELGIPTA